LSRQEEQERGDEERCTHALLAKNPRRLTRVVNLNVLVLVNGSSNDVHVQVQVHVHVRLS